MSLDSMADILHCMEQEGKEFWEVVLAADMEERQVSRESSLAKMLTTWQAMVDASDSYTGDRRSVSGLVGGDGLKMRQYAIRGKAMSGGYVSEVIAEALSMAESNACMRRIVAAPTAGACGVLPAVLLPLCKYEELNQRQILEALYVASGIGAVIAYRACIAGAAGGCQAEIGVAVSMASAALCSMMTDDPDTIHCAASLGGQVLMGLLCNPIEGYVQVPCIVRNMAAVPTAVSCANAALAGMDHIVPLDDVVALMLAVGEKIRPCDEAGTYILKKGGRINGSTDIGAGDHPIFDGAGRCAGGLCRPPRCGGGGASLRHHGAGGAAP